MVIAIKKTVKGMEPGFSITQNGCVREWMVTEGRPDAERPYCDLISKYKGSGLKGGDPNKDTRIQNNKSSFPRNIPKTVDMKFHPA